MLITNRPIFIRSLRVILIGLVLTSYQLNAQWALVLDKENVKVYNKPTKNGMSYYKAEAIINTSISNLYLFFIDFSAYPNWVNNCSHVKVLEQIPDSLYIYYSYFDLPWPASDRDAVSKLQINHIAPEKISVQSLPADYYFSKEKHVIRIDNFEEHYTITEISQNKVLLKMQGSYDPGGFIPDWLVRKLMKYGPFDTIIKIRSLVDL